jgi:hypothetical protein
MSVLKQVPLGHLCSSDVPLPQIIRVIVVSYLVVVALHSYLGDFVVSYGYQIPSERFRAMICFIAICFPYLEWKPNKQIILFEIALFPRNCMELLYKAKSCSVRNQSFLHSRRLIIVQPQREVPQWLVSRNKKSPCPQRA